MLLFWQQHAAGEPPPAGPLPEDTISLGVQTISREQLPQVWQQASWLRVIEVFDLAVDPKRRRRDDEIWVKSPFTQEEKASMHVSLSENIFKDFSSGKGGGIMQFCREMLRRQGLEMTMFEVAQWMVTEGISTVNPMFSQRQQAAKAGPGSSKNTNPAIEIDLRSYLRPDHPELDRRGISAATCRYLGCGFLSQQKTASPLSSRLVFQVRGVRESSSGLQPVILMENTGVIRLKKAGRSTTRITSCWMKRLGVKRTSSA